MERDLKVAFPMRFSFPFDTVRGIEINIVGPFDADELQLIDGWLEVVKRSFFRSTELKKPEGK